MKSNCFKSISYLLGIGALSLASSTLSARAEVPSNQAPIDRLPSEATPFPAVELAARSSSAVDLHPAQAPISATQPAIPPTSFAEGLASKPALTHTSESRVRQNAIAPIPSVLSPHSQAEVQTAERQEISSAQVDSEIAPPSIPGTTATSAALLATESAASPASTTPKSASAPPPERNTTLAQTDLDVDFGRGTRGVPSYIGVGGNIGLSDEDDEDEGETALGEPGFVINSKIGLTPTLSVRPSVIFGDDVVFMIPLTYDFAIPTEDPFEPVRVAPFAGGGLILSTDDNNNIGFLVTGGVDVPISSSFVANASLNVGFIEDTTDFGLILGVGYTFPNFSR
ncbi:MULTISPECIES: hypothetical protein [unclassified Coleofasciculus]|uniref:hypothetical protein n=1 Tax=unclassified Coleofasciculus TaxID=2692782 RepID=UPI00187E4930|nr:MULTISPECIES: hypothetical protein [unclassified Coleofasciculus]MBE9126158.1 hypothetical protein [Coleofasciculus sp. LEGE 07081]MBE9149576.1 hypothetical protein [Coleofasciculus sp. LEGE 07092]